MERNDFPRIPIGKIGGVHEWYLTMKQGIINNVVYYYPCIHTQSVRGLLKTRVNFTILKNDGSYDITNFFHYLKPTRCPIGKRMPVDELLNEENGYLTNGGITIEYGFQIEGILGRYNIWEFNFHDRLFDCQEKLNMISFYTSSEDYRLKFLHCHKQLLVHHSTYFNSSSKENQMIELTDENPYLFNWFLQFSHGQRDLFAFHDSVNYAQKYKLFNVIKLLDQLMVFSGDDLEEIFPQAMSHDLKHCLANFLNEQKTSKELAKKLKKVKMNKMIGESMKKCVKRFFEF